MLKKTPKGNGHFLPPNSKYVTMREVRSRVWVAEMIIIDDEGNLTIKKKGEPGSRLQAQTNFKVLALEIINARSSI